MNQKIDMALYREVKRAYDSGEPLPVYMRQWLMRMTFYFKRTGLANYTDAALMERINARIAEDVTNRLLAGTSDR